MEVWMEIALRMCLATLAGVLLGANRWLHHKSAGVKTHRAHGASQVKFLLDIRRIKKPYLKHKTHAISSVLKWTWRCQNCIY
jgi:putative Mg2+ transporter-C (MgtC) family protein